MIADVQHSSIYKIAIKKRKLKDVSAVSSSAQVSAV